MRLSSVHHRNYPKTAIAINFETDFTHLQDLLLWYLARFFSCMIIGQHGKNTAKGPPGPKGKQRKLLILEQ